MMDSFVVPRCQAKASDVSGGQENSEVGGGSGTAGAAVDTESEGQQSVNAAVAVPRGSPTE